MTSKKSTDSRLDDRDVKDEPGSGLSTPASDHGGEPGRRPMTTSDEEKGRQEQPDSEGEQKDRFKVEFDDDDPVNPRNFTLLRKACITLELGLMAFAASAGSSIISPAQTAIAQYTGVSQEVTVLTVSLYVLGFAIGPSLWAPISEMFGRKWSMIPAMIGLGIFTIGTAVSRNATSVLVTRLFGGIFGSAPVSNVAAAMGDLYHPKTRGTAITFYAVCVVGGPTIAPLIGAAATVNPHMGWRWSEYISAIITFVAVVVFYFAAPELYPPVLLKRKAQRLREETGDQRYWHPHENIKLDLKSIVTKQLSRPLTMLFTEPMVMCIALYASFVYGLLYLTLEVFPIVYLDQRKWPLVSSTLPFLGLFVGVICAMVINIANSLRYGRLVDQNDGRPIPEARLPPMLIGGVLFVTGLFWFGWTANPSISWVAPTIATAFIGAGFNLIFQQCINFLIDTYGIYAASATAANTFLRSFLAFAFPLFARPMFHRLGVGPGMSLLGGIACVLLPVPLVFMRYGPRLRKMSRFPLV